MVYRHALLSSVHTGVSHRTPVVDHGFSHVLHWDTHGREVLLFGFHALGVVLVDLLHQLDLLLLQLRHFPPVIGLLLAQLHDGLGLLGVDVGQLLLPVVHVLVLGSLGLLGDPLPPLLLVAEVVPLHLFDPAVVVVGLLLEFPGIVQLDQVDGLLDVLELLLVGESDLLITPAQFVDPLDFLGVVLIFLDREGSTHWLILLTSTFFWMASLVSCLFFLTPSFSFCSCCRNNSTLFCIACIFSRCLFTSFFSLVIEI